MGETIKITELFGTELAAFLAEKITVIHPDFEAAALIDGVARVTPGKTYTQRVELIAEQLRRHLPEDYPQALAILMAILGPKNPNETGMFKHYYWVLPIGKFIERYGLDHFEPSMDGIAEVTQRNTGEYAVRPFIRKYPDQSLARLDRWARADSFHLRRLASEGLRPKLPWAPKLDTFVDNPKPVFAILESLKEDAVRFVRKSVANHLTDYLKVNPEPTRELIALWRESDNVNTQWIVKHATRKIS